MTATTTVSSIADIQEIVKSQQSLHIIGHGSKTALAQSSSDMTTVQLDKLNGIIEYQPDEYTIMVLAGTPLRDIQAALQKHGQYLPFDPMLTQSGTIGGTVACNLSGSRRWRYGGVRDFILGMRVVDGLGRDFRVGGKVVKNSAGFDLAKFFVGSLGRYAIFTELTFKVFPEPPASQTLQLHFESLDATLSTLFFINRSVFELDALDIQPIDTDWVMWIRIAGQPETLPARSDRLLMELREHSLFQQQDDVDEHHWTEVNDLSWVEDGQTVIKVLLSPKQIPALESALKGITSHRYYSVGGNIGWITTDDIQAVDEILSAHNLTGLAILGKSDKRILGKAIDNVLSDRIKQTLDSENKLR